MFSCKILIYFQKLILKFSTYRITQKKATLFYHAFCFINNLNLGKKTLNYDKLMKNSRWVYSCFYNFSGNSLIIFFMTFILSALNNHFYKVRNGVFYGRFHKIPQNVL